MKNALLISSTIFLSIAVTLVAAEPAAEPRLRAADIHVMKLMMDSPDMLRAAGLECRDPNAELDMRRGAVFGRAVTVGYRKGIVSLMHLRAVPEA